MRRKKRLVGYGVIAVMMASGSGRLGSPTSPNRVSSRAASSVDPAVRESMMMCDVGE